MKTRKRILSAVLASTVALSSYAAYADVVGNQGEDNGVTNGSEESQTGLTLKAPTGINLPAGSITKTGDEKNTVWTANLEADDLRNLPFSPVDESVGRNEAGYYLGFNVEKPVGLEDNYNNGKPKYKRIFAFFDNGVTTDTILSDGRWSSGSGTYDGDGSYMGCWFNLQYQWLKTCCEQNKVLVYGLEFDWGNDTKQTVLVIADPSSVDTDTFYYENCGDAHSFGADNICTMCGRDSVEITGISGGIADVDTMTGDNRTRYNDNLDCYSFDEVTTKEDGNYEVTCRVNVGKMKTATEGGAAGNKNVLAVVELDKIEGFSIENIKKGSTQLSEAGGDASWIDDASKFVAESNRKNNKMYVTLWMSMVPGVDGKIPDRTYTFKPSKDSTKTKTLTVKFEDTTEYTLKNEMPDVDDCTVTASAVNNKATVTVTPTGDKVITGGTVAGVALVPATGKAWSAEVYVKSLLTSEEKAAGTTEATLQTSHFSVATADRSDIEVADITAPSTSKNIEEEQNERFHKNLNLYKDAVTWDETSGIATVKVPSALMLGENIPGKNAANVCLVMKFKNKLTGDNGSYGIPSISDAYIEDGYTFADNTTAENKGEYAVLWISAHTDQFINGTKTVVYTDSDDKAIATVKLVDVPVVKPANLSDISRVTLTSATDKASITAAVKTKLGDKADLVSISVGDIPANTSTETTLDGAVTVTVTKASGKDVVFVNGNDETVNRLEITVPVNVPVKITTSDGGSSRPSYGGGSSSGSSGSGGSSSRPSGGSGSSSSTPTYLNVTGKTISTASNVVNGTERVTANSSNSTGVAVSVAKSDDKVSYVKIDSPSNTSEIAIWAEVTVRKANSDKLADVKKAAEEAINAVANSKGFAMNIDILNTDRKTVIPGKNVQLTVPVPEAYKGKKLYAYRITERGVAPILAAASNDKITLNAGEAGTYIITTEKLENALTQKRGDIDNGGAVSASDATLVLKHIVELGELKDEKLYFADVNEDGKINAKDATEILKIAAGITK